MLDAQLVCLTKAQVLFGLRIVHLRYRLVVIRAVKPRLILFLVPQRQAEVPSSLALLQMVLPLGKHSIVDAISH